jgi:hypothetical protein
MVKVERGEINFVVTATGTIDPVIFQAQVDQAKANVWNAQANLWNAQANLENAKANLTKADVAVLDTKKTLDGNQPLMERNVIAQATMDTAQTNYDMAVAQQEAAKAQMESAKSQVESAKAQVVFGNQNWSTVISGITPEVLDIREWPLSLGRPFTQQDVDGATKVCLLGQTVVDNLSGGIDPIGQVIRIKNVPFTVIGVLASKGQSTMGQDQDDTIIVPLITAQKKLFGMQFPGMVRVIAVQAREPGVMREVEDQIKDLLRQRHHIQPTQDNDFSVTNLTEIMSTAEESASVILNVAFNRQVSVLPKLYNAVLLYVL